MKAKEFARAGTEIWMLDRLRGYLLSEFVDDLRALEKGGLTLEECDHVKSCLAQMIAVCRSYSDNGLIRTRLIEPLQTFVEAYEKWNGPQGSDPGVVQERIKLLKELSKKRKRLSERITHRFFDINEQIKDQVCHQLWDQFERIPKKYPGYFRSLDRGFRRVRGTLRKAS